MDKIYRHYQAITQPLIWICGLLLVAISLGVTAEVFLRKVFSYSLGGVDELSGYAFAIFTCFAFSYAAIHKANIRIEVLYLVSPKKLRILFDLIAQIALLILSGFLTNAAYSLVRDSYRNGTTAITPLATPLVYPQFIWGIGLALLSLTLIIILLTSIARLVRRDMNGFWTIASPLSEADQAREEVAEIADSQSASSQEASQVTAQGTD